MDDKRSMVLVETQNIIDQETLLKFPVERMPPEALITAWSVLELIAKGAIDIRKEALRQQMFKVAVKHGTKEGNSHHLEIPKDLGGGKITKEYRSGKVIIDVDALIAFLDRKGLPQDKVIDKVPTVNTKALEGLIVAGLISQIELKMFTETAPPNFALKVKKPKAVVAMLPAPLKKKK